jgi:glutaredoxin-like protein NrdH
MVVVYTKNNCQRCRMTKRSLTAKGVDFDEVNVEDEPSAADRLRDMGFREMPIVDETGAGDKAEMWSGYRVDKIAALARKAS